ncbi:MAG: hypothetical protein II823_00395 [Kiritimatiellae bacterium]|nr:hypothetical protein [Kiritimatiellia bacterium]
MGMSWVREFSNVLAHNVTHYVESRSHAGYYCKEDKPIKCDARPLVMAEDGPDATLTKVYLTGLACETLVLKPDNFGIKFFKGGSWNRACDYLVLTEFGGEKYALFLELKSSLNDRPESGDHLLIIESNADKKKMQQLESSCGLFEFLKLLVSKECAINDLKNVRVCKLVLYDSIKPRPPLQSSVRPISGKRIKAEDIKTLEVHDAETLDIAKIMKVFGVN